MGYCTDFDFTNNEPDIISAIENTSGYGESDNGKYSDIKWYLWADHMKIVSKMFPDSLINISGEGEENGDQWQAYFKNGKSQICHAEISFPPYDESKLK